MLNQADSQLSWRVETRVDVRQLVRLRGALDLDVGTDRQSFSLPQGYSSDALDLGPASYGV
jgi:hypothetical protein